MQPPPKAEARPDVRLVLALCCLLAASIGVAYSRAPSLPFFTQDDPEYLTNNPHVTSGPTWDSVHWAFTSSRSANWHPLTWISHQIDWRLFGQNPAGHHVTGVAIHILNAILLFIVLLRMTGSVWKSAFVAAVFGLHPLRVESVAWVAERKDVLSGFFWMLTMLAYARYVARPGVVRYAAVAVALALGLMAKSMLVSLPIVLLLLDLWPLKRSNWPGLVREKLPLLIPVVASCVVTFLVQRHAGAVGTIDKYPLGERISNALVSYMTYVWKTVWPAGLSVIYPHPENTLPTWLVALSGALLIAATYGAWALRRTRPYITVGWFWYVITLVPVIGIVQVGQQGLADRYTYLPTIGLLIIAAWGIPDLLRAIPRRAAVLAVPACAVLVALAATTWVQTKHWRTSVGLLRSSVEVTAGHPVARFAFADALVKAHRYREAIAEFDRVLALKPRMAQAEIGAADALNTLGETKEAKQRLLRAIEMDPKAANARNNLGQILAKQNRIDEAIRQFETAIRLRPNQPEVEYNLGAALQRQGDLEAARTHFLAAIRLEPSLAKAHLGLGTVMLGMQDTKAALDSLDTALRLDPKLPEGRYALAMALYYDGDYTEAWRELRAAQRLGVRPDPRFVDALSAAQPDEDIKSHNGPDRHSDPGRGP